ncbi:PLP-dependent aminotransferase family protein [Crenobacter cavernae]|uniref:Putative 8-amino-7-oxononanoate synthase n=1 Tax=Crenobacter cavernae TaxID=2290923 RepID=A0A345Y7M9_9NEIS|nr:PLP-dependent aminotransferase family protein [Crenobacter cavernae]AXK39931.1 PLP-dependent aminotransferase family protein [Crenobacter cavernae]
MTTTDPTRLLGRTLQRDRHALPLYQQLYQRLRDAILSGQLPPGARLPASRVLAADLSTSRGTVEQAYSQLLAEGYLASRASAGTVVNPHLDTARLRMRLKLPSSPAQPAPPAHAAAASNEPLPFQLGLPALDAFPRKLWSRLAGHHARSLPAAGLLPPDPAGYAPLRQAISHHLALFRGIGCSADQVFITGGFQGALGLIAQVLLQTGDPVWMEDPGFFRASAALKLAGAVPTPVPVDEDGLRVADGIRLCPDARLVYCTPSHHSPLGVTLTLPRRLELLAWAAQAQAWIVEDDYDGEFRYNGPPLPALQSLDAAGRVLYAGSFSKTLFPGLRLGYLVVPAALRARFAEAADAFSPAPSILDQATCADFMRQGHFARHIKRMRQLYAERRAALAAALQHECGDRLRLDDHAVGLQLVGWLAEHEDDRVIAARLRTQGLAGQGLSHFSLGGTTPPALLFGFANVPVDAAPELARRVREALQSG